MKVEIYIEGQLLELDESVIINQIIQATDIYDPAKLRVDFTRTVSVPNTQNNNLLFGSIFSVNRVVGSGTPNKGVQFNQYKRANFLMYVNDRLFTDGYCRLDNVVFQNDNVFRYELTFFGGLATFFRDLGDIMLSELLSSGTPYSSKIALSAASMSNLWSARLFTNGSRDTLNYNSLYNDENLTTRRTTIDNTGDHRNLYFDLIDAENGLYNTGTLIQFANGENDDNIKQQTKYAYPVTEQQLAIKTSHKQRLGFYIDMLLFCIAKKMGYTIERTQFTSTKNPYFNKLMVTGKIISEHVGQAVNVVAEGNNRDILVSDGNNDKIWNIFLRPSTITSDNNIVLNNGKIRFLDNEDRCYTKHFFTFNFDSEQICFKLQGIFYGGENNVTPFVGSTSSQDKWHIRIGIGGTLFYNNILIGTFIADTIYLVGKGTVFPSELMGKTHFYHEIISGGEYGDNTIIVLVDGSWITLDELVFTRVKAKILETVKRPYSYIDVFPIILFTQNRAPWILYRYHNGIDEVITSIPEALDPDAFNLVFGNPNFKITISEYRTIDSDSEVFLHNLLPDVKASDFFLSYCKLFGVYPEIDNDNKVIRLLNRNEYYTNRVTDVDNYFCTDLEHNLLPLSFDGLFINLSLKAGQTYDAKRVKEQTGIENGALKINTGIEFNKDTYEYFKDTVFEPLVIKQKEFDEYGEIREVIVIPQIYSDELQKSKIYNPVSLLFANGYVYGESAEPRLADKYYFAFVNDTQNAKDTKTSLYNLSNCKSLVINNRLSLIELTPFAYGIAPTQPMQLQTLTVYPNVDAPTFSVDFNSPVLRFYRGNYPQGITIFERYWKRYLLDRYNQNTKIFTGYFLLPEYFLSRNLLREFFYFQNQFWVINKAEIRDVTKHEPIKLELVSVNNRENYYNGLDIGYSDVSLGVKLTVLDDYTLQPVAGASIKIGTTTKLTGEDGVVYFDLEPGTVSYSVSKSGYTTRTGNAVIENGEEEITVRIKIGLMYSDQITSYIAGGFIPVASASELNALRNTGSRVMGAGTIWEGTYNTGLDKNYIQVQHLDLQEYQSGEGWQRIGEINTPYTGRYIGNNLTINNLYQSSSTIVGLFCKTKNAKLENIIIVNPNVSTNSNFASALCAVASSPDNNGYIAQCHIVGGQINGKDRVGGLVGLNGDKVETGIKIINCTCSATITATETYAGGIAGYCYGSYSEISQCRFNGTLRNPRTDNNTFNCYGGIVGFAAAGANITKCKFDGTIEIKRQRAIGGIVGAGDGILIISECESSGTVIGNNSVCGIIGAQDAGTLTISNCINKSTVIADCQYNTFNLPPWKAAGISSYFSSSNRTVINTLSIGQVTSINTPSSPLPVLNSFNNYNYNNITDCYYCSELTGQTTGIQGTNKTVAQLKADPIGSGIFANWSTGIWTKDENNMPKLRNIPNFPTF
mgnify:CR=1 FL=1